MNILIIGNGFDLAHNLPTTYKDFLKFIDAFNRFKDICKEESVKKVWEDATEEDKKYILDMANLYGKQRNCLLYTSGTNTMVEVFKNRIEFANAGAPLVAIERIVDSVPVSRNENIAGFMHKCGICEERGSGYDKIIEETGKNELLAPRIENQNNQFTKAILFALSLIHI